jgi:hypothetical protein
MTRKSRQAGAPTSVKMEGIEKYHDQLSEILVDQFATEAVRVYHDSAHGDGETYVMHDVIPALSPLLHTRFVFQEPKEFDLDWYNRSIEYTKKLPSNDLYTLRSYTKYGDEIANIMLRTPESFRTDGRTADLLDVKMPANGLLCFASQMIGDYYDGEPNIEAYYSNFFTVEGNVISGEVRNLLEIYDDYKNSWEKLEDLVHMYIDDLTRIIEAAPKPKRAMRVFRGVHQDYLGPAENTVAHQRGFVSTTMSPDVMRVYGSGNLYEMIIYSHTSCVVMEGITHFPGEYEILIVPNTLCLPSSASIKYMLHSESKNGSYDPRVIHNPVYGNPFPYVTRRVVLSDEVGVAGGGMRRSRMRRSRMSTTTGLRLKKLQGVMPQKVEMNKPRATVKKSNTRRSLRVPYSRFLLDPVIALGPAVSAQKEKEMRTVLEAFA